MWLVFNFICFCFLVFYFVRGFDFFFFLISFFFAERSLRRWGREIGRLRECRLGGICCVGGNRAANWG